MIEVSGLTKRYGGFTAVRDLSLAVQPGEVLGLCAGLGWDQSAVSQTDAVQWRYAFEAVEAEGPVPVDLVDCSAEDADEPNDSIGTPTPGVDLQPGTMVTGHICAQNGIDHWAASSTEPGATTITVTWTDPDVDLDLYVRGEGGIPLGASTDVGTQSESVTVEATSMRTILVEHYEGTGVIEYQLEVSEVTPPA